MKHTQNSWSSDISRWMSSLNDSLQLATNRSSMTASWNTVRPNRWASWTSWVKYSFQTGSYVLGTVADRSNMLSSTSMLTYASSSGSSGFKNDMFLRRVCRSVGRRPEASHNFIRIVPVNVWSIDIGGRSLTGSSFFSTPIMIIVLIKLPNVPTIRHRHHDIKYNHESWALLCCPKNSCYDYGGTYLGRLQYYCLSIELIHNNMPNQLILNTQCR